MDFHRSNLSKYIPEEIHIRDVERGPWNVYSMKAQGSKILFT